MESKPVGRYRPSWETYWADLSTGDGVALWDCRESPEIPLFAPHFGTELPVIDVGCGNGARSGPLAAAFPRVVATDLAASAIDVARRHHPSPTIEYEVLDILDEGAVSRLHERIGDANVYVRAVLHQLAPADRLVAADRIAVLTGRSGCVFDHELTPASHARMAQLIDGEAATLPRLRQLADHFNIGASPVAGAGDLEWIFKHAGFVAVEAGSLPIRTVERLSDGSQLCLPGSYLIARPG